MIEWNWSSAGESAWRADRGLAYSDGLFETIRISSQGPVLLEGHRDRLLAGCRALGLPFTSRNWEHWWYQVNRLKWLEADHRDGCIIKIIVTRGSGGRGYKPSAMPVIRVISLRAELPPLPTVPVALYPCVTPVTEPSDGKGFKTLNRLEQVLAARELPVDCFEGLMCDRQGRPVEGTRTNLFVLTNGTLYTPPRRQLAVSGVMRRALMQGLSTVDIPVKERVLSFAQLRQSQGVFITSSVLGVLPVARVGCLNVHYSERTAEIQQFVWHNFGI